jgi:hypothetical protein
VLAAYETLRVYSQALRVSWLTLEALCDALVAAPARASATASGAPNALLAEVHCALLAAVMGAGDCIYTPSADGGDDIMALLASVLDRHTWPHVLYRFLAANEHAMAVLGPGVWVLGNVDYERVATEDKAAILHYLTAEYSGTPVCCAVPCPIRE